MPDFAAPSKHPAYKRLPAKQRDLRAKRILARLNEGHAQQAIADEEGISRDKLRVIVKRALGERANNPKALHAQAQIARLLPGFALAERQILKGDVRGVYALATLQKRLDVYLAVTDTVDTPTFDEYRDSAIKKVEHFIMTARPYVPEPGDEVYERPPFPREPESATP